MLLRGYTRGQSSEMAMVVRQSVRRPDESALVSGASTVASQGTADDADGKPDAAYQKVIAEAKRCIGHGGTEGAFPEEWDAQLLVDCGRTASGHRLVIFCPTFLTPVLDDPDELDRAFRFILLAMDGIAMREKYVFVYCYLGMDWSDPRLAHRLRVAYDILPHKYAKHLRHFYILHVTSGFRITMWTFWAWLSKRLWDKIEYVETLDGLCEKLQPTDEVARAELRRRFPQIVQRHDAEWNGLEPPVTFGVPLRQLCGGFGVDFTDKTTGRWYPRLPPALIFLCEVMEREAADEDFGSLFSADPAAVYEVVEAVDQGRPLGRDIPTSTLWCVLKLFLDCLPSPLLSFQALEELQKRGVREEDIEAQRKLLIDILHNQLPTEAAYVALYMASFLHTMCENAQEKRAFCEKAEAEEEEAEAKTAEPDERPDLTHSFAARVFASNFLRPRAMSEELRRLLPAAEALVETLIRCAEEPELWIGRHAAPRWEKAGGSSSDSSLERAPAAGSKDNFHGPAILGGRSPGR